MALAPAHVRSEKQSVVAASWGIYLFSLLLFFCYGGYTIYKGYEGRADPPSTFEMGTGDFNTPRVRMA